MQSRATTSSESPPSEPAGPRRGGLSTAGRVVRWAERLFVVAGIGLFTFLVYRLGPASVWANLRLVGWGILPVVAQEILAYSANTRGWLAAFPQHHAALSFRRVLAARMAGDAVNYLTPTGTLGGEFIRMRLLRDYSAGTPLVASVAVAKVTQLVGQVAFVLIGAGVIIDDTPLPEVVRNTMLAGLGVLTLTVVALVFVQRRGMFAPLLRLAERLHLTARAPELARRLQHLDAEIARFHIDANGHFLRSCIWFFAGWCLGILEIYLILSFLGVEATVHRAVEIEVLSVAIDGLLFFVPAKLGTQEGGKVLIFTVLGLDPAKGLSLGIIRRVRELSWAFVGLAILSRHQLTPRRLLQPLAR